MAIFTPIKNRKQTRGALAGTLKYILDEKKVFHNGSYLESGINCNVYTSYLEMITTKQQFRKTEGRQFYQYVQSFPPDAKISPEEVHRIGVEFAEKQFPGFEVVVATHCNTDNLHNHILVNSVSFKTGKKLHQNHDDLVKHRKANDEICVAHGQATIESYRKESQKKGGIAGEFRLAERNESWKFTLIKAIEEALTYSETKADFIRNMEVEGYSVRWEEGRKNITYTCPNGMKCRDNRLHDETYLKDNMEKLFKLREQNRGQAFFPEPKNGWMGELYRAETVLGELLSIGKSVETIGNEPPSLLLPPQWTDSKQRRREALKKLAQGHKLQSEEEQENVQMLKL